MTLRDLGAWLSDLWSAVLRDIGIVFSSSPLDWPLWTVIALIVVVIPGILSFLAYVADDHKRVKDPTTIWAVLGFGVMAVLTTYVTVDVWLGLTSFGGDLGSMRVIKIGYPILASVMVLGFILDLRKWLDQKKTN